MPNTLEKKKVKKKSNWMKGFTIPPRCTEIELYKGDFRGSRKAKGRFGGKLNGESNG